jgi:hypothetical protein
MLHFRPRVIAKMDYLKRSANAILRNIQNMLDPPKDRTTKQQNQNAYFSSDEDIEEDMTDELRKNNAAEIMFCQQLLEFNVRVYSKVCRYVYVYKHKSYLT